MQRLSPSTLNVFKDCPRCFWLDKVKSIKRPRGIFPSLPNGMDRVIKDYFDGFRQKKTLPPELQIPEFEGVQLYEDHAKLERWRNWRTGLQYQDNGQTLFGALDDLLVKGDEYIPFDYKTKGTPSTVEAAVKYYTTQLDCYALMLEANGMKTIGYGYLLYYSPKEVFENGKVAFEVQPIKLKTSPDRAKDLFRSALASLEGSAPPSAPMCEYCGWLNKFRRPK